MTVVANRCSSFAEHLELLRREIFLHGSGHLNDVAEVIDRCALHHVQMCRERAQALGQAILQSDLLVQPGEMQVDHFARRRCGSVEQLLHLFERNPHQTQRLDLLQPCDVRLLVQAVAGWRAQRGREEPDLVVVVERTHRHAGALCELTNLQWSKRHCPGNRVRGHERSVIPHVA